VGLAVEPLGDLLLAVGGGDEDRLVDDVNGERIVVVGVTGSNTILFDSSSCFGEGEAVFFLQFSGLLFKLCRCHVDLDHRCSRITVFQVVRR